MKRSTFVFVIVAIVAVRGNDDFKAIDRVKQEPPCSSEGGICTIAADCPDGHLTETSGLCPKQQKKGIECCYGLSVKETRCKKRGGICIVNTEFCSPTVIFSNASDCESGKKCCILV